MYRKAQLGLSADSMFEAGARRWVARPPTCPGAVASGTASGAVTGRFVERELREVLTCGQLARGFARFRCDECRADLLVAFSSKGRGFCPSSTGRHMAGFRAGSGRGHAISVDSGFGRSVLSDVGNGSVR
jgi:hypothetical protein